MNEVNLDDMSIVECKAMVYDCMTIKEQQDINIQVLNQKIKEKSQPVESKKVESPSTDKGK